MNKEHILKKYIIVHLIWTSLTGLVCLIYNQESFLLSYTAGSLLMLMNFFLLYWLWRVFLFKKVIALALILIVFKYALIGFFVYKILTSSWNNPLAFSIGLLTLVPAVVSLIFIKKN